MRKLLVGFTAACLMLLVASATVTMGQGPGGPPGQGAPAGRGGVPGGGGPGGRGAGPGDTGPIVGVVQYLVIGDLAKSLEFYHTQLGLESGGADPRVRLGWYGLIPFLEDLFNVKGNVRNITLRVPGTNVGVEPAEFDQAKGKPFVPRLQDPGAARLILPVRDLDALMGYFAKAGTAKVVGAGGKPVAVAGPNGKGRVAVVQDLNGFFVELMQPDVLPVGEGGGPGAPPGNNISGIGAIGVTVQDTDTAVRFYRDVLGLPVQVGEFMSDKGQLDAYGTPGAQYRISTVMMPGTSPDIQLLEFSGIERRPLRTPLQHEPGAMLLRLQVRGVEALGTKLKANGVPVLSANNNFASMEGRGGGPPTMWLVVRDPNNVIFQMMDVPAGVPVPGAAPPGGPGGFPGGGPPGGRPGGPGGPGGPPGGGFPGGPPGPGGGPGRGGGGGQ